MVFMVELFDDWRQVVDGHNFMNVAPILAVETSNHSGDRILSVYVYYIHR